MASRDLVGYSDLTLLVPHAVSMILREQSSVKTAHLSAARWLRYYTVLLEMPDITVKRCTTLNPATLLPIAEDGTPHDCVAAITKFVLPGNTSAERGPRIVCGWISFTQYPTQTRAKTKWDLQW